ncbi:MAG: hypothetical protein QM762_05990 [Chryseolinea sp.]
MESKEELYHHGGNPFYYEVLNDEICAQVLFALEVLRLPYTRVPHEDHGVRSLRFYVQDRQSLISLHKYLDEVNPTGQKDDALQKYELVYENSFI